MKILEKHTNNKNQKFTFWEGYDKKIVEDHPKDGSKGMMIVFISTSKLKGMLNLNKIKDIEKCNSKYVTFYEVPDGYNKFPNLIWKFKQKYNQPFKGLFGVVSGGL